MAARIRNSQPRIPDPIRKQAALMSLTMSNREIATAIGVSHTLINKWKRQPWWAEALEDAKHQYTEESKARLRKITEIAENAAMERLLHGDVRVLRDGNTVSVPVSARDAALVANTTRGALLIAEGRPTRITASLGDIVRLRSQMARVINPGELEPDTPPLPSLPAAG